MSTRALGMALGPPLFHGGVHSLSFSGVISIALVINSEGTIGWTAGKPLQLGMALDNTAKVVAVLYKWEEHPKAFLSPGRPSRETLIDQLFL
jgi:hypothetical protein